MLSCLFACLFHRVSSSSLYVELYDTTEAEVNINQALVDGGHARLAQGSHSLFSVGCPSTSQTSGSQSRSSSHSSHSDLVPIFLPG